MLTQYDPRTRYTIIVWVTRCNLHKNGVYVVDEGSFKKLLVVSKELLTPGKTGKSVNTEVVTLAPRNTAVSYTHLDVYKRQVLVFICILL